MSKFRTLLLAHHGGHNHAIHLAVKRFSENVMRRTDGQLTIATAPDGSLGNLPVLLSLVMDGTADMALPPYDRLYAYAPRLACTSLPFVFDDYAHVDRVIGGDDYQAWAASGPETAAIVHLGRWEWGFRQFTNSRRPLLTPDDMRGLFIRVPPLPPYPAAILALGGIPVMVEYSRLLGVIRQGLIDGQENPISVIHSLGLEHEQKYLSLLNFSYGALAHIINRDCFESLSGEQRAILADESRKAGEFMRRLGRSSEAERLASFARAGMQIDRPDRAPFKAMVESAYAAFGETYGSENVRSFLALVEGQRLTTGLEMA
jgi:tripartite ATP-independent transporter DctP family solute receptor